MNLAAIFTAAHVAARTATAGTYRARFAAGLKAAYTAAKAPKHIEHHTGRTLLTYEDSRAAAAVVGAEVLARLTAAGKESYVRFYNINTIALAGKAYIGEDEFQAVYTADEVLHNLAMEFGSYAGIAASAA